MKNSSCNWSNSSKSSMWLEWRISFCWSGLNICKNPPMASHNRLKARVSWLPTQGPWGEREGREKKEGGKERRGNDKTYQYSANLTCTNSVSVLNICLATLKNASRVSLAGSSKESSHEWCQYRSFIEHWTWRR